VLKVGIALTIGCMAIAPAGTQAQVITGRVIEVDSDRPIAAALITLVEDERSLWSAESDSAGHFSVAVPRGGRYRLRVERLGYATAISDAVDISDRESVDVVLRLSVTAVRLDRCSLSNVEGPHHPQQNSNAGWSPGSDQAWVCSSHARPWTRQPPNPSRPCSREFRCSGATACSVSHGEDAHRRFT
jgi:hypothetical protein